MAGAARRSTGERAAAEGEVWPEAKATGVAPDAIELHAVWRGEGGKPQFRATIVFTGEGYWAPVLIDRLIAKTEGTFRETSRGLVVDSCRIEDPVKRERTRLCF